MTKAQRQEVALVELEALENGKKAFAAGRMCVPAHDPVVMQMIVKYSKVHAKITTKLLSAWLRGWTIANLAAPVPA